MADTLWTKGPWVISKAKSYGGYDVKTACSKEFDIAMVMGGLGEEETNARLVAAAPEMAELLERFLYAPVMPNEEARALLTRIRGEGNAS